MKKKTLSEVLEELRAEQALKNDGNISEEMNQPVVSVTIKDLTGKGLLPEGTEHTVTGEFAVVLVLNGEEVTSGLTGAIGGIDVIVMAEALEEARKTLLQQSALIVIENMFKD